MTYKINKWQYIDNVLKMETHSLEINLYFSDTKIFRLQCNAKGQDIEDCAPILESQPGPIPMKVYKEEDKLSVLTEEITLTVNMDNFSISVNTKDGRELFETAPERAIDEDGERMIFRLNYKADERIYGLGQDPMARLDLRDSERRMWNRTDRRRRSGNNGIPFFSSSAGYGIFLNSFLPARFAIGRSYLPEAPESRVDIEGNDPNPDPWSYTSINPENHPEEIAIIHETRGLDLLFLCMGNLDDIQSKYSEMTGKATLLPRWSFGLIQSKNRYRSMEELLMITKKYRDKGIPLDCIVIDWLWFKEFGDLSWDKEYWPEPEKGIEELRENGVEVMLAQHPYIDRQSIKYPMMKEKGYLTQVPEVSRPTYDFTNPEARKHWWEKEILPLYKAGIRGYWTDMGEPEDDHPKNIYSIGGREKVHNQYALNWSKTLYEGQRKDFSDRVFILSRALSAGIQRYGVAHWSNDIESSWKVLRDQVVTGQAVALSGQLYWCTDIGGFMTLGDFSPELYIRWMQWGVFCTLFRTHGTRADNEPWSFGIEAEEIISKAIKLRYRLLPYIYSCIRQATLDGKPVVRAMALDFPWDEKACSQTSQYMFGPSILVAPITEQGARSRKVYLPEGKWYDFWDGSIYEGNQNIDIAAPLERIPLFIKAGSIIPTIAEPIQNTKAMDAVKEIVLNVYPGKRGSFLLYEDDGTSYSYEKGEYELTQIEMDENGEVSVETLHHTPGIVSSGRTYSVKLPAKMKHSEPQIYVDSNLLKNGKLNVHLTIINNEDFNQGVSLSLRPPEGWEGYIDNSKLELNKFCIFNATLQPRSDSLPLRFHGEFEIEITGQGIKRRKRIPFSFGSGFATRFQLLGDFINVDGIYTKTPVEEGSILPFYEAGERMLWNRRYEDEFNSMGYVYCWRVKDEEGPRPVSYAKCSVFSDKDFVAFVECSGDNSLMIWINDDLVFSSDNIVYQHILQDPININKGENTVLIKVAQNHPKPFSGRELGFSFRLVNSAGEPIDDLLYAPKL